MRQDQKHKQNFVSSWLGGWFGGGETQEEPGTGRLPAHSGNSYSYLNDFWGDYMPDLSWSGDEGDKRFWCFECRSLAPLLSCSVVSYICSQMLIV